MSCSKSFHDIVVVGGGLSGIMAATACVARGLKVALVEKSPRLGGIWSGHGVYDCLRLQQHKLDFFYPGTPWPAGTSDFPNRDEIVTMTKEFIKKCDLDAKVDIRLRTEVQSMSIAHGSSSLCEWLTTTNYGDVLSSKYIAMGLGALGGPVVPQSLLENLKAFGGRKLHSSTYFRPQAHAGKKCLVVGYGSSAVEIAADLSNVAATVTLVAPSQNSSQEDTQGGLYEDWCLSRDLGNVSRFCSSGDTGLTMAARNARIRDAMGKRHPSYFTDIPAGLTPNFDHDPLRRRIIVSEAFLDSVAAGSVCVLNGTILGSDGRTVRVGSSGDTGNTHTLKVDDIIMCTGYTPPLERYQEIMVPAPQEAQFFHGMWSPDVPRAAFLGIGHGFYAAPRLAHLQAEYLSRVVAADMIVDAQNLPPADEMRAWIERVSETNVMHSTQCMTDNTYFRAVADAALPGYDPTTYDELGGQVGCFAAAPAAATTHSVESPTESLRASSPQNMSSVGKIIMEASFKDASPEGVYSKWAKTYDEDSFDHLQFSSPQSCRSYALSWWPTQGSGEEQRVVRVLDAGCGTGALAKLIKDSLTPQEIENTEFHGTDLTKEMLDIAAASGNYTSLSKASMEERWPVDAGDHFDLVLCNGVMIYVKPSAFVVSEYIRVTKPGGKCVIMIREDNIGDWQGHLNAAEEAGSWRLVDRSEPMDNFPGGKEEILYRIYVFEVLERTMAARDEPDVAKLELGIPNAF
jgi:dimethylaniline monooxygenase (N-oxide forming)